MAIPKAAPESPSLRATRSRCRDSIHEQQGDREASTPYQIHFHSASGASNDQSWPKGSVRASALGRLHARLRHGRARPGHPRSHATIASDVNRMRMEPIENMCFGVLRAKSGPFGGRRRVDGRDEPGHDATRSPGDPTRPRKRSLIQRKYWYRHPGSNGGPLDPQSSALTN
jgi:hypothetical protein